MQLVVQERYLAGIIRPSSEKREEDLTHKYQAPVCQDPCGTASGFSVHSLSRPCQTRAPAWQGFCMLIKGGSLEASVGSPSRNREMEDPPKPTQKLSPPSPRRFRPKDHSKQASSGPPGSSPFPVRIKAHSPRIALKPLLR